MRYLLLLGDDPKSITDDKFDELLGPVWIAADICSSEKVKTKMNPKTYDYNTVIQPADKGGAYVPFPYDVRAEFGKGRVKVHAMFDGEPYDGSIVNMGVKNADGSVCYIIGIRKDIRAKISKQPGDTIRVTIREREL